jgi:hypothetical protein
VTEFAEAMEGIAMIVIGEGFGEHFEFDFDVRRWSSASSTFDYDLNFDGEDVRIHIERIERDAERAAAMAVRHRTRRTPRRAHGRAR